MNATWVVGWSLLHFVWQGAAVATLLAILLATSRHRTARYRYALSVSTLALMAALPLATAAWLSREAASVTAVGRSVASASSPSQSNVLAPAGDIRLASREEGAVPNTPIASNEIESSLVASAGPDLARLVADPGASAGTLVPDIVAAWYSGSYQTSTGLASIGYPNALLWDALNFTTPSGFCGGLMGFWGEASSR